MNPAHPPTSGLTTLNPNRLPLSSINRPYNLKEGCSLDFQKPSCGMCAKTTVKIQDKEIIGVHVGQAGAGAGDAMWDLLRREHGIMDSGYLHHAAYADPAAIRTMFQPITPERYFCRAVFVDTDPKAIDMIASGPQSKIYQNRSMISAKEPANGVYSAAKNAGGPCIAQAAAERIRRLTEAGDHSPEGFLFTHSMAGGTGSGMTAELLRKLKHEYPKTPQVQLAIFPEQDLKTEWNLLGFYNAGLLLKDSTGDLRTVVLVDNPGLFGLLKACKVQPNVVSYASANKLIAHVASALTACSRFDGSSPLLITDLETCLVPTKLLRFATPAVTPISKGCHCHGVQPERMETRDVTTSCFDPKIQLNSAAVTKGEPAISSSLVFRGQNEKDEINRSIHQAVNQYDVNFGEGVKKGFKIGLAENAPALVPFEEHKKANTSAALFNNTTALAKQFSYLYEVIRAMVDRHAQLHYYFQAGAEPMDFAESIETLHSLLAEYKAYGGQTDGVAREKERKRNWAYCSHGVKGDIFNCDNVSELRQYACKCYLCTSKNPCPTR